MRYNCPWSLVTLGLPLPFLSLVSILFRSYVDDYIQIVYGHCSFHYFNANALAIPVSQAVKLHGDQYNWKWTVLLYIPAR